MTTHVPDRDRAETKSRRIALDRVTLLVPIRFPSRLRSVGEAFHAPLSGALPSAVLSVVGLIIAARKEVMRHAVTN
jgi:hypothetical protein